MESDGSLGLVKSDGDERLGRARLGLKSAQLTTIRRLRRLDRFRASEWSFSCFCVWKVKILTSKDLSKYWQRRFGGTEEAERSTMREQESLAKIDGGEGAFGLASRLLWRERGATTTTPITSAFPDCQTHQLPRVFQLFFFFIRVFDKKHHDIHRLR